LFIDLISTCELELELESAKHKKSWR